MRIRAKLLNALPSCNPTLQQGIGADADGVLVENGDASHQQHPAESSPTKSPMKNCPRRAGPNPGAGFNRILKGRRLGRQLGGPHQRRHNSSPRRIQRKNKDSGRYQFVNQYFSKKPLQGGQQKVPNKLTPQQQKQQQLKTARMPNMLQVKVCKDATPDEISFRLQMPGFKARNVRAILRKNRVLIIRGRRMDRSTGKKVAMRERFVLNPARVHPQSISMHFDEQAEVLSVSVRKKKKHHPARARLIPISTKQGDAPLVTKKDAPLHESSQLDDSKNAMEWFEGLIPDAAKQEPKTVGRSDALTVSFQNMAVQSAGHADNDEDDTSTLETAESDSMESELAWCYVYVDPSGKPATAADGSQDVNPEPHNNHDCDEREAMAAPLEGVHEVDAEIESSSGQQEHAEAVVVAEDPPWDDMSDDGEVEHA